MPRNVPAPNSYNPLKHTETTYKYSFGKANRIDEAKIYKDSFAPAPGAYEVRRDDKQEGPAYSFKGGALE